jgi:predicted restriction endonuclease
MISHQTVGRRNWTRKELIAAFNLYCQLPFGKLHKSNPQIMQLAVLIDRTPSAVAYKLVNFASLDPFIINSGRVGMGNVSALDRQIWDEFNTNWENLAVESESVIEDLAKEHHTQPLFTELVTGDKIEAAETLLEGRSRSAVVQVRVNQSFFRRAVLASYQGRCCMSGVNHPRLLVASHIVPWSLDVANRLNPRNGLCLSALHDRAFDSGLISLNNDYQVIISDKLKHKADEFTQVNLLSLQGKVIALPEKFLPDRAFLEKHRVTFEANCG